MSTLTLYWPLDAITGQNLTVDLSANKLNGTVRGGPTNLADPRMGACLQFDGGDDLITLADGRPAALRAYTVEVWARPAEGPRAGAVWLTSWMVLNPDGSLEHRYPGGVHGTAPGLVNSGTWRHVAVTSDGTYNRIYLDGVEVGYHNMMLDPAAARAAAMSSGMVNPLYLGGGDFDDGGMPGTFPVPDPVPTNVAASFAGRLAHLRIYDGALTPAEIARDMAEDEAAAFSSAHPFEFAFVNGDVQPVLYILDNPVGQTMALTLTNATRRDVTAVPGADWHFALRFRRGTLPETLTPRMTSPEWAMTVADDRTELRLRWTPAKAVPPGGTTTVWIDGVNADGAEGTRGTRVVLAYRDLAFVGEGAALPPGTRQQFLDVVNHRGRRDIPLDLRLVGGDRVPCDGMTSAALKLQLTHMAREGAGIALRSGAGGSQLRVSFDVQHSGENRPWALALAEKAEATTLAVEGGGWSVRPELLGSRMQWTLTPDADRTLPADASLTIDLDRIVALASVGHAPILLEYRAIPGYADGTLVVQVERSPLLYTDTTVTLGSTIKIGSTTFTETELKQLKTLLARG